jgi:glycosyltransferase involved in cell wall biosynthesis
MRILWSLPVRGETLASTRGDLVRARSLIAALRDNGHEVVVVEDGATAAARGRVRAYRSVVRRCLPSGPALMLRDLGRVSHGRGHARRVAAEATSHRADLIVETQVHFSGSGALAARLTGLPLILDDCSPPTEEATFGCALPGLARRVFDTQVAHARAVIVPSDALRERMEADGVPSTNLHVVPNGVDLDVHGTIHRRRHERADPARLTLVFAGSFQPWHRPETLVEAVGILEDERLHLLLLGDGPGRAAALDAARRSRLDTRVTAPGALESTALARAIGLGDIGVLPATNDYGHPMKLLDYAAAGLAIVAPDLPPVREVIEDGETGLLFRPGDAADLAAKIRLVAGDPALRTRLGAAARVRIAERGSWHLRANALIDVITGTVHRRDSNPVREAIPC